MKRTSQQITLNSSTARRVLSSTTRLALTILCGLLLTSSSLAQEGRPEQTTPEQPTPAAAPTQKPPDPNETLTPSPLANQTVDGDIVFTSPGQFTYPRDIRLSDNFGGLRFYGADSLTTSPAGAAIQFFGNQANPFSGQLYLDSGAHNSAALIFRTAPTGGTITERMRVSPLGRVGIGTTNPLARLHVLEPSSSTAVSGGSESGEGVFGDSNSNFGVHGESTSSDGVYGFSSFGRGVVGQSGGSAAGVFGISNTGSGVVGTSVSGYAGEFAGRVRISTIPQLPTNAPLCFTFNGGDLLQCGASSLRFKTDVRSFVGGLDLVRRLRPISFRWKESGLADIGLGAEEVAEVAPSFAFTDSKGVVTGVKYERLNMVLINAIKEQQAQIEGQQKRIDELNAKNDRLSKVETENARLNMRLEQLSKVVCAMQPLAATCR